MSCLICNHDTKKFIDEKSAIAYYYCPHCQCISKSQVHFKPILEQKARYDLHENDPEDEGYRAYFRRFLDFVLPLVGTPKSALDFGCGRSSLLAEMLKEEGIGSDYYDPVYHPDNLNDSKKYELIVSTEVFEHLHDPKAVFAQLLEMLEVGGYLALQTQFHPNDIEAFKRWYYHLDPTHIVFFTPHTFSVMCVMYGCTLIADNGKNMVVIRKNEA
ncbi:class I SAM-dependent methyltransferase [Sulfurovum sp.]|uniref:class I SAM-dependent methyltransferase n=1 Tax=Sulfurovum sp. TaxID=1969726 RepID=UPI002A36D095|nr:class I SAM-dependent methyltransferase [Sulfurovum sp.]MDD2451187.1 class I SAM-dependent methyltransferase [Sulfurovum sp.]MDD3499658.1 class I SAM-dependent methyltransferase [Sulfurovum sp.]MDY0402227.1 class I SAM-dependent methyltransferase [Sulfurovum sp.]